MSNYEGISEMLDNAQFSEEVNLSENKVLKRINLAQTVTQDSFRSITPTMALESNFKTPHKNDILDISEFFTVQKIQVSSIIPQSPNQISTQQNSSFSSPQGQIEHKSSLKRGKEYKKNIMGYIAKKSIKIMLDCKGKALHKKCKKAGLSYRQFREYFEKTERSIYGPHSLTNLFKVDGTNTVEVKRMQVFQKVLTKILRKRYMIYSLKLGKMDDLETYVRQKNAHLLYFADSCSRTT